jgi:hypothetical protein
MSFSVGGRALLNPLHDHERQLHDLSNYHRFYVRVFNAYYISNLKTGGDSGSLSSFCGLSQYAPK